jgi:Fic family protein
MKINQTHKKWIWEQDDFPKFTYTEPDLTSLYFKFGQLKMIEKFLNEYSSVELLVDRLANEAIATSAIEGEILPRSSVSSSINQILRLGLVDDYTNTYQTDALIEIIVDAKTNRQPLDKDRLSTWHRALFPLGQSGLKKIEAGQYRTYSEAMQIVSGTWEKKKIHYIAPPSNIIECLMTDFITWLNSDTKINQVIKATIAHLYFVLIHPFEDGNGRITRAITDYVLIQANLVNANFYSIATAIYKNRKEYYKILENTCQSPTLDITAWIEWFLKILHQSIDETLAKVEVVKIKTQFWDQHINTKLNERQKKVIQKMLSYLPNEFKGGMRVNKYMSLTKSTRIIASRDLADLVQKEIMQSIGRGRGTYYILKI